MRKLALSSRKSPQQEEQDKAPVSIMDLPLPLPALSVGNEDLNLTDWSYYYVRETLEAGQVVKKSWLYDDVLEEKSSR